ncbi:nickel-responsive transcriptional regulator NikR [Hydrogenophaga sp. NFH-34]|uniref:nickel-responsive transcriptional regulator NikR n=1 Tax=Hydrogenophaga sp. NFH-34 TaxID=2744446 RepID=UPI001F48F13F|nr:nickel-responsive transcriptional regulator NikR [Hydrogenophaga sp. NFH-34]
MRRFTITIDDDLDDTFGAHMVSRGYANRSEAVRDLIREEMNKEHAQQHPADPCVAVMSYLYVPQQRSLALRLIELQRDNAGLIDSCTATQVNEELRMEVQLLRGRVSEVRAYAWSVVSLPGVTHGEVQLRVAQGALRDNFIPAANLPLPRKR